MGNERVNILETFKVRHLEVHVHTAEKKPKIIEICRNKRLISHNLHFGIYLFCSTAPFTMWHFKGILDTNSTLNISTNTIGLLKIITTVVLVLTSF